MKKQAAFAKQGTFLKGALHVHTTRSDGSGTPEQVLSLYASKGYDFVALTDHRNYNYANFGNAPLTIVPGMEMDAGLPGPGIHCHHIVSIGPSKADGNGFDQDQRFDSYRYEDPAEGQKMLDWLHENNNMTIYCHPEWSGTPACEFDMLNGNFAMEVWNSGCAIEDNLDTNAAYWDDLLANGKKIWGVATDDGHPMYQHGNGWVRVNAKNDLNSILAALNNGEFYASCGPEIYDFWVDKGIAHVECSPCVSAGFRHLRVPYRFKTAKEGEIITSYEVKLRRSSPNEYIRAVVMDAQGRRAWSNPIFLDDSDFE